MYFLIVYKRVCLQFMDINENNENTHIQCFVCHQSISIETNKCLCQECLNRESQSRTAVRGQIGDLQKELDFLKNQFKSESANYLEGKKDESLQIMLQELRSLQSQANELQKEEKQRESILSALLDKYCQNLNQVEKEVSLLRLQEIELKGIIEKQSIILPQTKNLENHLSYLKSLHLLKELYSVYSDNQNHFINQQMITVKNTPLLLEILSLLADKYHYQGFKVNFCEGSIKTSAKQQVKIDISSEVESFPWLTLMAKETVFLWEHMKQQISMSSTQNYQQYSLPFEVSLYPEVSIKGVRLRAGSEYMRFVRLLVENVKGMMNLDAMSQV